MGSIINANMKLDITDKNVALLGRLLEQLPISSTWVATEISGIINDSEIKETTEKK